MGNYINTLGLIIDIVGALLIFKHGIPSDLLSLMESGYFVVIDENDPMINSRLEKHRNCANAGLVCLMLGFFLQAVSNWT